MTGAHDRVAVVTGANSGIGRATALHLGTHGFRVLATVRSPAKADKLLARAANVQANIELIEMDVADDDSVSRAFANILSKHSIDVLVNNAGIGGNGVVEESSIGDYLESFNVNVLGVVRCTQAVLPSMRARRSGTIVNVSSVVGRLAAIAQSPYVTSKWALEGLSEELAQEVAPFGIRVAIVEPGITRSSIFGKNVDAPNASGAYDSHYRRMFRFYEVGHRHASPAEEVAQVIHEAIVTESPQLRYPCSWGGTSIVEGRAKMDDETWVRLADTDDDREYFASFRDHFDIDLDSE
jgi:NAD(P)-dependent dehydrogenase (short-subunit alcohol dehydrogenase family)